MDGRGGKEGKKDGRRGGWHCQTGGRRGDGERCVNWQPADRWKARGGVVRKVCRVSKGEYNGVQADGDGRPARHGPPLLQ